MSAAPKPKTGMNKPPAVYPVVVNPNNGSATDYQITREPTGFVDHFFVSHNNNLPIAIEYGYALIVKFPIANARNAKQPTNPADDSVSMTIMVPFVGGSSGCHNFDAHSQTTLDNAGFAAWYKTVLMAVDNSTSKNPTEWAEIVRVAGWIALDVALTPRMRCDLNLRTFPSLTIDKEFKKFFQGIRRGALVSEGRITILTPQTFMPVRTSIAGNTTIFFHHHGDEIKWTVVPPTEKENFEALMHREVKNFAAGAESGSPGLENVDVSCPHWVNHLNINIQHPFLVRHGIVHYQVTQMKDQLLFLFPGSYFFASCEGTAVLESKYHGGTHWDSSAVWPCVEESVLCSSGRGNLFFEKEIAEGDRVDAAEAFLDEEEGAGEAEDEDVELEG
ncbi:hypothetical protein B0J14DRAFT_684323 [Halenospora varia]|nr:hypothetical protein B0J14DRAFT_684323 [Halenospora varia]